MHNDQLQSEWSGVSAFPRGGPHAEESAPVFCLFQCCSECAIRELSGAGTACDDADAVVRVHLEVVSGFTWLLGGSLKASTACDDAAAAVCVHVEVVSGLTWLLGGCLKGLDFSFSFGAEGNGVEGCISLPGFDNKELDVSGFGTAGAAKVGAGEVGAAEVGAARGLGCLKRGVGGGPMLSSRGSRYIPGPGVAGGGPLGAGRGGIIVGTFGAGPHAVHADETMGCHNGLGSGLGSGAVGNAPHGVNTFVFVGGKRVDSTCAGSGIDGRGAC